MVWIARQARFGVNLKRIAIGLDLPGLRIVARLTQTNDVIDVEEFFRITMMRFDVVAMASGTSLDTAAVPASVAIANQGLGPDSSPTCGAVEFMAGGFAS